MRKRGEEEEEEKGLVHSEVGKTDSLYQGLGEGGGKRPLSLI